MSEKEREKDVGQIVRYLTATFNTATAKMERPFRGKVVGANQLYNWQTEFAYRLNEVIQGPRAILQFNISKCNEFIDEVVQALNKDTEQSKT